MYIFAFHPKFSASPFSHYGQPPRAERTPSAQDSHPERRIVWEISLEAEKQRESGIKGISTWEWFYAIRPETKKLVCHFNPWLWKERNYPSHIHPDHPFTLSPFITLIRTGLTDPVCTVVHKRSTAMWGLGLRAGGMERKETDSIKT